MATLTVIFFISSIVAALAAYVFCAAARDFVSTPDEEGAEEARVI